MTNDDLQIVFTDTPGIHKAQDRLGARMNREAADVIQGVDLIYLVVDGSVPFSKGDQYVLEMVKNAGLPVFLILNKVDQMSKEQIIKNLASWQTKYDFDEYFPMSAKFDTDFQDLVETTAKYLPEGDLLYPADMISDGAENFRIAEIIREKILLNYGQEIPYSCQVEVESFKEGTERYEIAAVIYVMRDSQKGIIIGKGGSALKRTATQARIDMEDFFQKKVFLSTFVKVDPDWRNSRNTLSTSPESGR